MIYSSINMPPLRGCEIVNSSSTNMPPLRGCDTFEFGSRLLFNPDLIRMHELRSGEVHFVVSVTWGGFNWFTLNNPKKSQLWGIDFAPGNANVLVAVGDSGLILRTSNAGESWSVIQFQAGVIYEDVDFVNSNTGYVVGSGGRIFKTTNAGANWFQQTSPTGASFLCVNFFDENFGAIGGTTRLLQA